MGRLDLPDKRRDEDRYGAQMTVEQCIRVAEIGSDAWIREQVAFGKGTDERDA